MTAPMLDGIEIHHVIIGVVRILWSIDRANLNDWCPSLMEISILILGYVVMPHWREGESRFSIILKKLSINSHLEI